MGSLEYKIILKITVKICPYFGRFNNGRYYMMSIAQMEFITN